MFKVISSTNQLHEDRIFNDSNINEVQALLELHRRLRHVYTKRQSQCSVNTAITLAIQLTLKTMKSLANGVSTHFGATPLLSMRG